MNKLWYAVILCKTNILLLVASVTQDVGSGRRMLHSDYLEVTPPVAMETARLSSNCNRASESQTKLTKSVAVGLKFYDKLYLKK